MSKIKLKELSHLSETLLIPLTARGNETLHSSPVIKDEKSLEILSQIDPENINADGGNISTHGILARTIIIDQELNKLLLQNPESTVINLGAGLDTRLNRLDNGLLTWYDLDLKEVIELRSLFFAPDNRIHSIPKSVLDFSWIEEIVNRENVIIIAEGLLMYFSEDDVKIILQELSRHFPKSHMFFDAVGKYFVGKGIHDSFLWGIDRAKDIENFSPPIQLIQSWSTGNLLKERQSLVIRLLNIFPATKNRSQILHIQL
jgi:O-methyltransferase involved in polyketide biosynthesis